MAMETVLGPNELEPLDLDVHQIEMKFLVDSFRLHHLMLENIADETPNSPTIPTVLDFYRKLALYYGKSTITGGMNQREKQQLMQERDVVNELIVREFNSTEYNPVIKITQTLTPQLKTWLGYDDIYIDLHHLLMMNTAEAFTHFDPYLTNPSGFSGTLATDLSLVASSVNPILQQEFQHAGSIICIANVASGLFEGGTMTQMLTSLFPNLPIQFLFARYSPYKNGSKGIHLFTTERERLDTVKTNNPVLCVADDMVSQGHSLDVFSQSAYFRGMPKYFFIGAAHAGNMQHLPYRALYQEAPTGKAIYTIQV